MKEMKEDIKGKKSEVNTDDDDDDNNDNNKQSKDYEDKYGWYGTLGWDAKDIKDKLVHDQHTGELVGATQDAFELDVIYQEMLRPYPNDDSLITPTADYEADTNEDEDNVNTKIKPPTDLVKKYLVCIFTTWDKSQKKTTLFCLLSCWFENYNK
eukprot:CAMPEP_0170787762 /NCGR_PEP_ID=MMETSP0733-20121128/18476_1 /TAXON_ID=186038 /ORGANISM="Fragilariopsis kerguelensis, Strain L26-C5" /LENGTH=153 /DNA_ID=CAMNT_0011134031 /DNA_START=355 /DNA_END=816 /DNA_ORIENTATION=-